MKTLGTPSPSGDDGVKVKPGADGVGVPLGRRTIWFV